MASEHSLESTAHKMRSVRKDFAIFDSTMNGKPLAYLDTASSAQKPKAVMQAQGDMLYHGYANIHRGLYKISQDLTTDYEDVRRKVADFLGANSEKEIIFTRNTTEGINLVAQSWGRENLKAGDEIILTEMEHHANIVPWQLLRDQIGIVIKVLPITDAGELDIDKFDGLLSDKTKLVSFVHISNALGTINSVKDIVSKVKSFNGDIKVLVDGSQSAPHINLDVEDLGCDFFVFTGHKLYGPTGIGVLYGKYDVLESMPPYQGGGDMIETVSFEKSTFKEPPYRFEAGTPPIAQVIGLGAAIDYVNGIGFDAIELHDREMLRLLRNGMQEIDGLNIYGDVSDKVGIISFTADWAHASDIGAILDQCGIAIRAGHHCCMPLMKRLGVDATVRASMGLYTIKDDIDQFIEGLNKAKDMLG